MATNMLIRRSYYSKLNGDDEMTWGPDPLLTALGVQQAESARTAWIAEIPAHMPTPERCYASPLHRALSTWQITFGSDETFPEEARTVTILEVGLQQVVLLRAHLLRRTCAKNMACIPATCATQSR